MIERSEVIPGSDERKGWIEKVKGLGLYERLDALWEGSRLEDSALRQHLWRVAAALLGTADEVRERYDPEAPVIGSEVRTLGVVAVVHGLNQAERVALLFDRVEFTDNDRDEVEDYWLAAEEDAKAILAGSKA